MLPSIPLTRYGISYRPSLPVLFMDQHLLCVSKPSGLSCQPHLRDESTSVDCSLETHAGRALALHRGRDSAFVGTVHRLDRPASGIVVLALRSKAANALCQQFEGRRVVKDYLVVVKGGVMEREEGVVPGSGMDGDLRWMLVKRVGGSANVLRVRIATGRKHQIRRQLVYGGVGAIVGDVEHGAMYKYQQDAIMLHACRIQFKHPASGEVMTVQCAPPWAAEYVPEEFAETSVVVGGVAHGSLNV